MMRALPLALASLVLGASAASAQQAPAASTTAPAASSTAPAAAAATPNLTTGATVYDVQGNEIATIASVSGTNVVVSTGTNKVTIPASSFGTSPKGPVIAATRAQLDAAAAQAAAANQAALNAKLVAGSDVRGLSGVVVGQVKQRDADAVLLTTPKGDVRVPVTSFTVIDNNVVIGMTAAEFDAAVAAAKS